MSMCDVRKHDLVFGGETLIGKHRAKTFVIVGHQVCNISQKMH